MRHRPAVEPRTGLLAHCQLPAQVLENRRPLADDGQQVAYSASRGSSASDFAPDSATTRWKSTYRWVTTRSMAASDVAIGVGVCVYVGVITDETVARGAVVSIPPASEQAARRPPAITPAIRPEAERTRVAGCSASSASLLPFPAKWPDGIGSTRTHNRLSTSSACSDTRSVPGAVAADGPGWAGHRHGRLVRCWSGLHSRGACGRAVAGPRRHEGQRPGASRGGRRGGAAVVHIRTALLHAESAHDRAPSRVFVPPRGWPLPG